MLKKKSISRKEHSPSALSTKVGYNDFGAVEQLLGAAGMRALEKVIRLISDTSQNEDWPLTKIEVNWVKDYEVKNWQYIWIVLVFETNFDKADEYLNNLYPKIDKFATALTEEEQLILQKKLFFDVRATLS